MTATTLRIAPQTPPARLAGEAGVWVFVAGDLLLFGVFFLTYAFYRAQAPEAFRQAAATLSLALGTCNTLVLLTGSWFVARAVHAHRHGLPGSPALIGAGIACGLGFVAVKAVEWGRKFAAGITVTSSDYFMFYFMLTGIHLLHVLVGIGVLVFLFAVARRPMPRPLDSLAMESGGIVWHLIDLLWIVLFALFYLLR